MSRDRSTRWFVGGGLLVALAVAVLLGPLASSSPDGLEAVAERESLDEGARPHDLEGSPLADYGVRGVDDDRVGTGLAGLAGVLLTFGIGMALFGLVARRRRSAGAGAVADRPAPGR